MILGIVGYFGVGKSTAAAFFQKKGWKVLNVDRLGHRILERKEIKKQLREAFGRGIFERNKISRKKLGAIVFHYNHDKDNKNNQTKNNLTKLNRIVHPELRKTACLYIKKQQKEKKNAVIDGALLAQLDILPVLDSVVLITASKEMIYKRAKKQWQRQRISYIHKNQRIPLKPDFIINNDGTKKELEKNIEKLLNKKLLNHH